MGQKAFTDNTLFYGDNLKILRDYLADESVDLIYLDPPFNSSRAYNVLFKDEHGAESEAQITAFEDTWHWSESPYEELRQTAPYNVGEFVESAVRVSGRNQLTAYLVMMAARLLELHRVLKSTGCLYLHCDSTASHYLKTLLDAIFGEAHFQSEIIWKRTSAHSSAKRFGPVHDIIFFYSKSSDYCWNPIFQPYDASYISNFYRYQDADGRKYRVSDLTGAGIRHGETGKAWRGVNPTEKGRHWSVPPTELDKLDVEGRIYWPEKGKMPGYKRYLEEMPGVPLQDTWTDIQPIGAQSRERLGYPTQKPLALLERILQVSSNEGDIVLDPFCGCGTAIHAAQKLDRKWLGIDITHLAIALIKNRLKDAFDIEKDRGYAVVGEPEDLAGAQHLAESIDRYQFQWWAISLIAARPYGGSAGSKQGKKGADSGIDGVITFNDDPRAHSKRVIVQVKSGNVSVRDIRDLRGTLDREHDAAIGVFITLQEPTKPMLIEAESCGFYHSPTWQRDYPKLQILTIEQLLNGATVQMPPTATTYKKAQREQEHAEQTTLL